jgi:glycosyltransferase involved in cell wall biosynthesis
MRILFVNQTYAPDVAASAQLLEDMARRFADAGHEVAVVTSRSLYGQAGTALPKRERRDGVEVHRIGVARFGKGSVRARTIDAAVFYLAAAWRAWRVRLPGGRPQVVVTLTSPPYIGFVGALTRLLHGGRRRGFRYVAWTMDVYPDVLTAAGIVGETSLTGRLLRRLNLGSLRLADRVVVVGRCMQDRLVRQGIDPGKIDMISVWSVSPARPRDEFEQPSSYRDTWGLRDKFVVMYSGNLGIAHEAATLRDAARRLQHRDDIRFVFVGGGKRRPEIRQAVAEQGLTNVLEKGYEPRERLADLLRLGDLHLISQRDEFTGVVVPSKLFGIMAGARPALYVGPAEAEVARVLTESGGGRVLPVGAGAALAEQIIQLADDPAARRVMGRRAHDAAVQRHSLDERFARWEALLHALVAPADAEAGVTTQAEAGSERRRPPLRVLFINQAYAPDAAATAQHCEDLARYLAEAGCGVSVIASRSIYGEAGAALPQRELRHGVNVHRVGLSLFGKRGILLRSLDFGLFYAAATWRALWLRVPADGRRAKPDVIVTLTTPPFIGAVGALMRKLRRCHHVYWAMDLYPDVLVAAGVTQPKTRLVKMLAWLNRKEMASAHRVVALGRCMRDRIVRKGVAESQVEVIGVWSPNEPAAERTNPAQSPYRQEWGLAEKFVVQYSGNFGLAHDEQTFADAILRLRDRDDIVFLFAGGGKRVAAMEAFVEEHGLSHVMFRPYQPRERLPELLTLADVHLISQAEAFTGIVVPSKLFGIMSAGRASLFVGPAEAEVARVLEETGGGRRFAIGDGAGLAGFIERCAADRGLPKAMGAAALAAARGPHHQRSRFAAWHELLEQTAPPRLPARSVSPAS